MCVRKMPCVRNCYQDTWIWEFQHAQTVFTHTRHVFTRTQKIKSQIRKFKVRVCRFYFLLTRSTICVCCWCFQHTQMPFLHTELLVMWCDVMCVCLLHTLHNTHRSSDQHTHEWQHIHEVANTQTKKIPTHTHILLSKLGIFLTLSRPYIDPECVVKCIGNSL